MESLSLSCSVMSTSLQPMDYSPPGPSAHGIFQARILKWAAISFSKGSSWPRVQAWISCTAGRFTIWATSVWDTEPSVYWCLINFCCLTQVGNNPAEEYIFPKSLAELFGFGSHFCSPHHLLGKMSLLLQNSWPLNSDWPNFVLAPCWSF